MNVAEGEKTFCSRARVRARTLSTKSGGVRLTKILSSRHCVEDHGNWIQFFLFLLLPARRGDRAGWFALLARFFTLLVLPLL